MTTKIIQVRIGNSLIGLHGLKEIFQEVADAGVAGEEVRDELLRRVAARNYIPAAARGDYREALWREFRRFRGEEVEPENRARAEVKVLGLGCAGCRDFYQQVVNILEGLGTAADLEYITDPVLLHSYQVRAFPALVINGRVALAGSLPTRAELEQLLAGQLQLPQNKRSPSG